MQTQAAEFNISQSYYAVTKCSNLGGFNPIYVKKLEEKINRTCAVVWHLGFIDSLTKESHVFMLVYLWVEEKKNQYQEVIYAFF